jgi:hypothetical protein
MSMVAGAATAARARVSGRTVFVGAAGFADFAGAAVVGTAEADAVRFARLALPIRRCSSWRSRDDRR